MRSLWVVIIVVALLLAAACGEQEQQQQGSDGCAGADGCVMELYPLDNSPNPDKDKHASEYGAGGKLACGGKTGDYRGVPSYSNSGCGSSYCSGCDATCCGLRWQCVEYVERFYKVALGFCSMRGSGNAKAIYGNTSHACSKKLYRYANGGTVPPQPDDIIAWGGGTYGHVAIVRAVHSDRIVIIHQNFTDTTADGAFSVKMSVTEKSGQKYYSVHGLVGATQGWMRTTNTPVSTFACKYHNQSPSGVASVKAGEDVKVEITFTNKGNVKWVNDKTNGVSNKAHVEITAADDKGNIKDSPMAHSSWINSRRITSLDPALQSYVAPGQTARFRFTVRIPKSTGKKKLYVIPTLGGVAKPGDCFNGAHFYFDVSSPACKGDSSATCGNCGTKSRTCSGGKWSSWSACKGEGSCKPKATKACGSGGIQECSSKCQWGACKTCSGSTTRTGAPSGR